MKSAALRFNCYLLVDGLPSPESALQAKYRPGGSAGLKRIAPTNLPPAGSSAYLGTSAPKTPKWASVMAEYFPDAASVSNESSRLVVFLPVGKRWFAVCFGYGSGTLDWDKVVTSFGLRVAARRLRPNTVTELRSRRIDATARTQSVTVASGTELRDLGVDLEGEFVRKLVGRQSEDGTGETKGALVGGDSIAFNSATDLVSVQRILQSMLVELEETSANESFAFVDSLEPLRKSQAIVRELETVLSSEIMNTPTSSLGHKIEPVVLEFAPTDDIQLDQVESFQASFRGRTAAFEDPTLASLRDVLRELRVDGGTKFLSEVRIIALGSDGGEKSQSTPLTNWLVFEAKSGASRFMLTLGKWFNLKDDYAKKLDKDLKKIRKVTPITMLPPWSRNIAEGDYNRTAAIATKDLLLMDRDLVKTDDGGKFEACDLLHSDGFLIHVKKYNGSQTLSHLFSQGGVSAELLISDSVAKKSFRDKVTAKDASFSSVAKNAPTIVTYAIAIGTNKTIPDDLPTFSKVNLRDFAKRLRNARVEPTLAQIDLI